uniref:4Fe-4S ferredoxin-type domain-containing protein n=1 Tax=Solibacter usitatus (strain Ellin6076) TaxID=234267 RepID=Q022P0_SOLUE
MEESIAHSSYWLVSGRVLFLFLHLLGLACFGYIVAKRLAPLFQAQRDPRWDQPLARLRKVFRYWLCQWRHPRYRAAGIIHILIFSGFLLLVSRAATTLALGVSDRFAAPLLTGRAGQMYDITQAYAATVVFLCVALAAIRRIVLRPVRYRQPAGQSRWRPIDAILLLALIGILMLADGLLEATSHLHGSGHPAPALSLAWLLEKGLAAAPLPVLHRLRLGTYLLHEFAFFFLLCYRPFGIQFHVETSLFSIYFAKLERGVLKPVRWGVPDEGLDQLRSFGVKRFEDFTWKQMLDFYSCADCGRCSDQCPAQAAGRALSPRLLTTKARDYSFRHYPVLGKPEAGPALVGAVFSEDEIWSCTTCGACEAECPLLVEYIDKVVDLRRGLVDEGRAPQSLHKPLKALESRGNPFGKPEKKRADWAQGAAPVLNGAGGKDTLYFADSITSYDDRAQSIGRATARVLGKLGMDFGILGAKERDSGHDVRRFGEETLFLALRDHNSGEIRASGVRRIVTGDPHAYNALKHDYRDLPPVEHTSQVMAGAVRTGQLRLNPVNNGVFAYHDPCYLGRHNGIYEDPRDVLDSIPGLRRVEMKRCRDRSFCCGGGGLALFYEAKEEQRMGVMRVRMAAEAGAGTIVTACPYCMVNIEDAIKVAGLEGQMAAIDLAELVDRQMTS